MEEQKHNSVLIRDYFILKGWTPNSIYAMLGNMQTESNLNPQIWESLIPDRYDRGYGLVQWTPMTKLRDWATAQGYNYTNGYVQMDRIQWELENNEQWSDNAPYTFLQFAQSTGDIGTLAMDFLRYYERPSDLNQPWRATQAIAWAQYLGNIPPGVVPEVSAKSKITMWNRLL